MENKKKVFKIWTKLMLIGELIPSFNNFNRVKKWSASFLLPFVLPFVNSAQNTLHPVICDVEDVGGQNSILKT